MRIRVYHADLNPAVDSPSFHQSMRNGDEIVASGQGEYFNLSDGRLAIRLYRSRAARDHSWVARLEELTTAPSTDSAGMPYLKIHWPESVKQLRAESLIPNVRSLAVSA